MTKLWLASINPKIRNVNGINYQLQNNSNHGSSAVATALDSAPVNLLSAD